MHPRCHYRCACICISFDLLTYSQRTIGVSRLLFLQLNPIRGGVMEKQPQPYHPVQSCSVEQYKSRPQQHIGMPAAAQESAVKHQDSCLSSASPRLTAEIRPFSPSHSIQSHKRRLARGTRILKDSEARRAIDSPATTNYKIRIRTRDRGIVTTGEHGVRKYYTAVLRQPS